MTEFSDKERRQRSDKGEYRLQERDFFIMPRIIEQWSIRLDHLQYLMARFNAVKLAELLLKVETEAEREHLRKLYPTYITDKAAMQWVYRMRSYDLIDYRKALTDESGRIWATANTGRGDKKKPGGLTVFDTPYRPWKPLQKPYLHDDTATYVRFYLEERAALPIGHKDRLPIVRIDSDRWLKHQQGLGKVEDDRIADHVIHFDRSGDLQRYAVQYELTVKELSRIDEIIDYFDYLKDDGGQPYYKGIFYYVNDEVERFLTPKLENRKKFVLRNLREVTLSGRNGQEVGRYKG